MENSIVRMGGLELCLELTNNFINYSNQQVIVLH